MATARAGAARGWFRAGALVLALLFAGAALVAWLSSGGSGLNGPRSPLSTLAEVVDDGVDAVQEWFDDRRETPPTSPFEDVAWPGGDVVRVMVGGTWYELDSIDGWKTAELLRFIDAEFGASKREKRFEEDLPEVFARDGRPIPNEATLRLKPDGGAAVELNAKFTEANRQRLWARRANASGAAATGGAGGAGNAAAVDGAGALREFGALLAAKHSYTVAAGRGPEIVARVEAFLIRNPAPTADAAMEEMQRIIGETIDGHAAVDGVDAGWGWRAERGPWLPLLLCPLGDEPGTGVVAVRPDRSGLVDAGKPYVAAINGVEIEMLIERAGEFVADGSAALRRDRACRLLRSAWLSGIAEQGGFTLSLAPSQGSPRAEWSEVGLTTVDRKPVYGAWPRAESRLLADGRVGYLRIAEMSDDVAYVRGLHEWLDRFAACEGLVIDVRGNGGGSRAVLVELAGRLMRPGTQPLAYNAAKPLVLGESPIAVDRRMRSRFLERAPAAGMAIRPEVGGLAGLDGPQFGPWYVGEIAPGKDPWMKPGRRVVVLMDQGCFSATDVFLMAMKEIEGVTMVGRPSAGGSGLSMTHPIAGGAVRLTLSSMVSFGPDGAMLDGRGVTPDVKVAQRPGDLVEGGGDSALDEALRVLEKE